MQVLHSVTDPPPSLLPSWPHKSAAAGPMAPERNSGYWEESSPPLPSAPFSSTTVSSAIDGEDWREVINPHYPSSAQQRPWWRDSKSSEAPPHRAAAVAVSEESREGYGHQTEALSSDPWTPRGPSSPPVTSWGPVSLPSLVPTSPAPAWSSEIVPGKTEGGGAAVASGGGHAEPPLANQLRQLAASALPFSQAWMEALD